MSEGKNQKEKIKKIKKSQKATGFQGDFAMFQRMHDPAYLDREKWNL